MLNTKKFKNQLNANLITPITNRVKEDWSDIKQLQTSIKQLQSNVTALQDASKQISNYTADVERLINQWQFKSQPRLDKIQEILNKMK